MPNSMQPDRSPTAAAKEGAPLPREWLASDGLRLAATTWRAKNAGSSPPQVLCLAGLSRNSRDFTPLAEALAARGFDVTAMDYRGRGRSDHDTDWRNYAIEREAEDIDCGLDALGIPRAIVIGTSRGGLHAMLLALRSSDRVAGMVLNDIGPTIERDGLHRLAGTIGHTMEAPDWPSAAARLRDALGEQFPGLDDAGWERFARQLYVETPDGLHLDYDENCATRLKISTGRRSFRISGPCSMRSAPRRCWRCGRPFRPVERRNLRRDDAPTPGCTGPHRRG
ncbi:MAG: alpha/beta fold hydrolase [Alphaproteobacteria bacterium]|nr:alpha/beta fold hydrolase [Alphaproteobacteria bacterium]